MVIAFPALLGLRLKYPDICLKLITTRRTAPFARSLNIFDEIHEIDDAGIVGMGLSAGGAFLRNFRADTVVNLEVYSNLAEVLSLLTCSRNRLGYYLDSPFWRKGSATHLFFFNRCSATPDLYDKVFQSLDVSPAPQSICREYLEKTMPDAGQPKKPRISIGHACSDLGKERMLTVGQWEKVFTSRLDREMEREVIFLGAAKDSAYAQEIIGRVSKKLPNVDFLDYCGKKSLVESLTELRSSSEFWGIDSALAHYARLLNIKSVTFWGPTDPATRLREFPDLKEEVLYKKIPCSPCIHVANTIPCKGNNICIQGLFEDDELEWIDMLA